MFTGEEGRGQLRRFWDMWEEHRHNCENLKDTADKKMVNLKGSTDSKLKYPAGSTILRDYILGQKDWNLTLKNYLVFKMDTFKILAIILVKSEFFALFIRENLL